MSDYRNFIVKLDNKGLNIAAPPDTIPQGQYTNLLNVRSVRENVLSTRFGVATVLTVGEQVNQIVRVTEDALLLLTTAGNVYRNETQLLLPGSGTLTGHPVNPIPFRSGISGQSWTYIGDASGGSSGGMIKVRNSDGQVYEWGIVAPTDAATAVAAGAGNLDSSLPGAIAYDWRYTYYATSSGAESNPSPVMPASLDLTDQQALVGNLTPSLDIQVDKKRIYRRGGTINATWRLVDTVDNDQTTYTDNTADSGIALALAVSLDNDVPFTSVDEAGNTLVAVPLQYTWGPFAGKYIFACGDPNRPGYVYWTNVDQPDGAAPSNNVSVTSPSQPLINGFVFGSNSYVWTRDELYTLDFGGPTALPTFTPRLTPVGMGLSAPWAFAVGPVAVFFLYKDGIYATDCQTDVKSVTHEALRPIFLGESAAGFAPVDMTETDELRLEYIGTELHFFYKDINGLAKHLFYDIRFDRWQEMSVNGSALAFAHGDHDQPQYNALFADTAGHVMVMDPLSTQDLVGTDLFSIAGSVTTYSWDAGIPMTQKEWGNALIDADPKGNTITVTPLYDNGGTPGTPAVLTGSGRQDFPVSLVDTYARNAALRADWTGPVDLFQFVYLFRDDEEPVKHWEEPETSYVVRGLQPGGWTHIRDGYFALRSTADVTLTVTIDGTVYTYTLASTSGNRRKVYVKFRPIRGKMYRWALDCPNTFRLYGEDTHIYVKPWNTAISYQPVQPFTQTGMATFLRREAGT